MKTGIPGGPKTPGSGRKKGTPNRSTLKVEEILQAYDEGRGINPIVELLKLYELIHCDNPLVATKIMTEIAQYIYPKRKAIEHSGEINNPYLEKPVKELEALVRERLEKK